MPSGRSYSKKDIIDMITNRVAKARFRKTKAKLTGKLPTKIGLAKLPIRAHKK